MLMIYSKHRRYLLIQNLYKFVLKLSMQYMIGTNLCFYLNSDWSEIKIEGHYGNTYIYTDFVRDFRCRM